jgi:hypothetical protein
VKLYTPGDETFNDPKEKVTVFAPPLRTVATSDCLATANCSLETAFSG